jgi:putative ABC transport system substrate-binding protein
MADRVTQGMVDTLKTIAPQIEVEIQPNLKDIGALGEVFKRYQTDKKAVVLLRSTGAKFYQQNKTAIPGFFGACNDPVELGILKNSEVPEGNITGVTYAIPYQTQFETFMSVLPKSTNVLLIVETGHPSSSLNQAGTKAACAKMGLQYLEKSCQTKEEVLATAKEFESRVSFILLGSQALLIDNGGALAQTVKVPVLSYTEKPVTDGALCGLVANDAVLGKLLAESIVDVLVKGKAIKEVPVKLDPKPQLLINEDAAKRLEVEIPFDILQVSKMIHK